MSLHRSPVIACLFFLCSFYHVAFGQRVADVIIVQAKIATLDNAKPLAQAIAISGNIIIGIGTDKEMLKFKNARTKVIDAKGKRIIPGLFDSHLHVIRGGRFYNTELRWDGVKSLGRALDM